MSTNKSGKAGASRSGFCMYIGPSIAGTIQNARILYGSRQEALAQVADAMKKCPLIASLIVTGQQLPEARLKVKTPGNLLYLNYHKLASGEKREE